MARPLDMGESLVGAYLRYCEKCDFVVYGTQTEKQGEIDVIGFQVDQRRVWMCEVATHLDGLQYRGGTLAKVRQKVKRAVAFGEQMFPRQERRFEWWSPKAGPSLLAGLEELAAELSTEETAVEFIVNEKYAQCVGELFEEAQKGTKTTPEPFLRSLQILAHLAGKPVIWHN